MPVWTGCRSSLCLVLVMASSALTRNRAPSSQILVGNVFASRKCSHCLGKVAWSEKNVLRGRVGAVPLGLSDVSELAGSWFHGECLHLLDLVVW